MVQTMHDQITRAEGWDVRDQIAFCAFHSFLVEVQTNAGYIMWRMHNNNLELSPAIVKYYWASVAYLLSLI